MDKNLYVFPKIMYYSKMGGIEISFKIELSSYFI